MYMHTVEHLPEGKREKLLIRATTWMDLKGIILSEKHYLVFFFLKVKIKKITEMEER